METYYYGVVHPNCYPILGFVPSLKLSILKNDEVLIDIDESLYFTKPLLVLEKDYSAGDKFSINVQFDWGLGLSAEDYTVKVYSIQDLQVKDNKGEINMLHMDG